MAGGSAAPPPAAAADVAAGAVPGTEGAAAVAEDDAGGAPLGDRAGTKEGAPAGDDAAAREGDVAAAEAPAVDDAPTGDGAIPPGANDGEGGGVDAGALPGWGPGPPADAAAAADSGSDWDDGPVSDPNDDGTGWIHPENLPDCLARDGLGATTAPTPAGGGADGTSGGGTAAGGGSDDGGGGGGHPPGSVPVGIVTTDFAMQNVALQMGLRLLSVDGRRPVTAVRRHVLRCTPCGLLTREVARRFCGRCGHAALIRLPYTVTADGVAVVAFDPHRPVSTRGTRYSIPKTRGGRAGHAGGDLVLAEDVAALRALSAKHSARPKGSVGLGEGEKYNPGAVLVAAQRVRVGYGRRNPNAVRPGGGNRKKK